MQRLCIRCAVNRCWDPSPSHGAGSGYVLSAFASCYIPQFPREWFFKDLTVFVVLPVMYITSL